MPRNAAPGTAVGFAMPDDVREELLRAQQESMTTFQQIPRVKVMAAGARLFEFDDNNETVREFTGVVLHAHPRNLLWDKPYGEDRPEEDRGPACSAPDGRFGTPRAGFQHIALPGNIDRFRDGRALIAANGTERIECATCPYNAWNSKELIGGTGKGKATTNQRSVYILVPGRQMPVELILPPTSLKPFDAYCATLLNQQIPLQAVHTKFTQELGERGSLRWGVVKCEQVGFLEQVEFDDVLVKRRAFLGALEQQQVPVGVGREPGVDEEDDTPF
jgi:hypothetical protein